MRFSRALLFVSSPSPSDPEKSGRVEEWLIVSETALPPHHPLQVHAPIGRCDPRLGCAVGV
jgi:hypothetical protein